MAQLPRFRQKTKSRNPWARTKNTENALNEIREFFSMLQKESKGKGHLEPPVGVIGALLQYTLYKRTLKEVKVSSHKWKHQNNRPLNRNPGRQESTG